MRIPRRMRTISLFLVAAVVEACSPIPPAVAPPEVDLMIAHVTVIDVTSGQLLPDTTILIKGDRIERVAPSIRLNRVRAARSFDGTGKFVIPGLWDMHAHTRNDHYARTLVFPLEVANGITGIRLMAGDCIGSCAESTTIDLVRRWRAEKVSGTLLAPRIVAASPLLDGSPPIFPSLSFVIHDAVEARRAVHLFQSRGVDLLKVYSNLPRDAFFALVDEARRAGMPVVGHLPIGVTAAEASDAGIKSLEHMHGMQEGCSSIEKELIDEQVQLTAEQIRKNGRPHPMVIYIEQAKRAFDHYDEATCHALYERFVRNGTWISPTLYTYEDMLKNESGAGQAALGSDPRLQYIPAELLPQPDHEPDAVTAAGDALRLRRFQQMLADMQHTGVGIIAGSDASGSAYHYPGFGLHETLRLLVEGGLTPLEALQTATINAAKYFGTTQSAGTVEAGKVADLVVLNVNPLGEIRATGSIDAVVLSGRLLDRHELDTILASVRAEAARTKRAAARR
jgi:imidazolonepropionase-like amidohydrolase